MAVDHKKLKVGDKVRYLGGDVADDGGLTIGQEYVIKRYNILHSAVFDIDSDNEWSVEKYNAHCFELVDDKQSGSTCNCACKNDSHIASLAKEVAELKRELTRIYDAVFESNEKHRRIEDDIVLLDERLIEVETKKPGEDKTQYVTVYGSEYIDKLFGGDSE